MRIVLCARARASFDSVVISGSTSGAASSLCKDEGKGEKEGGKRTMQEIDNHRTFNYFLSVAPELSYHGQELSQTWDLRTLLRGWRSIIRHDFLSTNINSMVQLIKSV